MSTNAKLTCGKKIIKSLQDEDKSELRRKINTKVTKEYKLFNTPEHVICISTLKIYDLKGLNVIYKTLLEIFLELWESTLTKEYPEIIIMYKDIPVVILTISQCENRTDNILKFDLKIIDNYLTFIANKQMLPKL